MKRVSTVSIRAVAVALFVYSAYATITLPVGIGEAVLWDHLIRPPIAEAFRSSDAWLGLGYAIVAKRAIGLFRLSEFSLRLPAVLSGLVCAWFLWRKPRPLFAAIYVGASLAGWFSRAEGQGMALAFCSLGLFGLAIAASPAYIVVLVFFHRINEIERIVIPAVALAFAFLVLPASHGEWPGPKPPVGSREAENFRSAVQKLRNRGPLQVGADPEVLPLLEYYRARFRQRDWTVLMQRGQGWWFSTSGTVEQIK
jgi:hypothetical protein